MDQIDVVVIGFLVSLAKATISVIMFSTITFLLLRLANKLSGIHFESSYREIALDPKALSVYLSVRYAVLGLGNAYIIASNFMY
jgi:hypothetical protein